MSLSPDQKTTVASWVKAGATLSDVQKRIGEEFKITMTYMDVRFMVDDLDLTLIDQAPKADASDVSKVPTPAPQNPAAATAFEDGVDEADLADGVALGGFSLAVDAVTLIPGAVASGSVQFSDGVTGKWVVDNYGRPGFTEISQPGYRPTPEDSQLFMQELSAALESKGMG